MTENFDDSSTACMERILSVPNSLVLSLTFSFHSVEREDAVEMNHPYTRQFCHFSITNSAMNPVFDNRKGLDPNEWMELPKGSFWVTDSLVAQLFKWMGFAMDSRENNVWSQNHPVEYRVQRPSLGGIYKQNCRGLQSLVPVT